MATLSPLERNAAAPPCIACDTGARAEECAACFVGMVQHVIAKCGSTVVAETLAVALPDLIESSRPAHTRLAGVRIALDPDRSSLARPGEAGRPLEARFGLTRRQSRVAQLLAEGHPNKEIARRLYISPHTARHHTQHLMLKLGARSRTAAAAIILGA